MKNILDVLNLNKTNRLVIDAQKDNYIKGLNEQIQILKDIIELKDKHLQIKDEHIVELETKIEELLGLLNRAIEFGQHKVLTFN